MITSMNRYPNSVPGIYLITNRLDGTVYVGQARKISSRWSVHRHHLENGTHHCRRLQRAWTKEGASAFTFSVAVDLSTTPVNKLAAALTLEEARVFALHEKTYNGLHPTKDGPIISDETRALLSLLRKRAWLKAKQNPAKVKEFFDRVHAFRRSKEGRAIFSRISLERWADPVFRSLLSKRSKEKWDRVGYREAHAAMLKAAWAHPEKRSQRLNGLKRAWSDPATRAKRLAAIQAGQAAALEDPNGKMRLRPQKRWADPSARGGMSKKTAENWANPAIRERQIAAIKAAWADPVRKAARLAKRQVKT